MPTKSFSAESKLDPRYVDFFQRFNEQQYFEAHEVLEALWHATDDDQRDFYKGLIQTAAVFLKLQQGKPQPAARLAERATSHLEKYRPTCECLDVNSVVDLLRDVQLGRNLLAEGQPPRLELRPR
jgi:predicted metal-dependent hydrolase